MHQGLSLYLDVLRLAAAMAVFVAHSQGYLVDSIPLAIASHGDEAVAAFFVLSGFVIAYVADQKETTWRAYTMARLVRLFSVVPIALFITFIADMLGNRINPAYYETVRWYNADYLDALLRNLTFTNEVWLQSATFGSNHAYWSLGFEAQYYLLFGLITFLPQRLKAAAALTWIAFVGPIIAAFLLLWWLGVFAYRACERAPSFRVGAVLWIMSGLLYVLVKLGFSDVKIGIPNGGTLVQLLANFLYFLAVGLAVTLNILGARALMPEQHRWYQRIRKPITWLAGGAFSLYLVHEPLLALGRATLRPEQYDGLLGLLWVSAALVLCYLAAELGERRKRLLQGWVKRRGVA